MEITKRYLKYGSVIIFNKEGFFDTKLSHSDLSIFPSPLISASKNVWVHKEDISVSIFLKNMEGVSYKNMYTYLSLSNVIIIAINSLYQVWSQWSRQPTSYRIRTKEQSTFA